MVFTLLIIPFVVTLCSFNWEKRSRNCRPGSTFEPCRLEMSCRQCSSKSMVYKGNHSIPTWCWMQCRRGSMHWKIHWNSWECTWHKILIFDLWSTWAYHPSLQRMESIDSCLWLEAELLLWEFLNSSTFLLIFQMDGFCVLKATVCPVVLINMLLLSLRHFNLMFCSWEDKRYIWK